MDREETVGNIVKGCKGESSLAKGRDGSDERVDGQETVGGNSLGRAPLGRSETEATTG